MTALCRYGIRAAVFAASFIALMLFVSHSRIRVGKEKLRTGAAVFIGLAGCFLQYVFFAFEVHPLMAAALAVLIFAATVPGIVVDRRQARRDKE